MKSCTRCKETFPLSAFYVRRDGKSEKPTSRCKTCIAAASKERNSSLQTMTGPRGEAYRSGEKVYAPGKPCRRGHHSMKWVANDACCECVLERDRVRSRAVGATDERKSYYKSWVKANPGRVSAIKYRYSSSSQAKDKARARFAERYASDIGFVQKVAARNLLGRVIGRLKRSSVESRHANLGYSASDLAGRMQAQFQPGMSWHNYGDWEIDHKKPVARFVSQGIYDPRVINMLCNLQPLWKAENRRKSSAFR